MMASKVRFVSCKVIIGLGRLSYVCIVGRHGLEDANSNAKILRGKSFFVAGTSCAAFFAAS